MRIWDPFERTLNACWVCEIAFNESKPLRLPEKEEERIILEGRSSKKIQKKSV